MTPANALGQRISRMIAMQGPISIAQFMTLAMHAPHGGYYATRDPLGADFITAPELTQVFGEMLGLWCAQAWHDQGRPERARLVELGPGRGTLMADALNAARLMPEFLAGIEVVLVERSPVLAAEQKERLRNFAGPVRWASNCSEIPQDLPQFTLANEFLDALPIQQFVKTKDGWCERMIGLDAAGDLVLAVTPHALPFRAPAERGEAAEGAVYEFSAAAIALVEDLARGIAGVGGAALFIDYGYDGEGFGDTLQAVGANRFQEVLAAPGEVDLSAHVDFAALARAARGAGAHVFGPVGQGRFLEALGINRRWPTLEGDDRASSALRRLVSPDQMGTLFKVMAIAPGSTPPPPGFG